MSKSMRSNAVTTASDLAECKALVTTREAALEDAQDRLASLRGALASGDDSVTGEALSLAIAEVERATALLSAAESALTRAERAPDGDTSLAEMIASILNSSEDYAPLAWQAVTSQPSDNAKGYRGYVLATGRLVRNVSGGYVSGTVVLVTVKDSTVYRTFDEDEFLTTLNADPNMSVSDVRASGEVRGVVRYTVEVAMAFLDDVPVIAYPGQSGFDGTGIPASIQPALIGAHGEQRGSIDYAQTTSGSGSHMVPDVRITDVRTNDAGETECTAVSRISVRLKQGSFHTSADMASAIRRAAEAQVGQCFTNVGRLKSVDITQDYAGSGGYGLDVVLTQTFVSRAPSA